MPEAPQLPIHSGYSGTITRGAYTAKGMTSTWVAIPTRLSIWATAWTILASAM